MSSYFLGLQDDIFIKVNSKMWRIKKHEFSFLCGRCIVSPVCSDKLCNTFIKRLTKTIRNYDKHQVNREVKKLCGEINV